MILVTGASGGIGRAILPQLAEIDQVIGLYNQQLPALEETEWLKFAQLDLRSESDIKSFVARHQNDLRRLTIVHCAARSIDKLAVNCDASDWDAVLDVNLKGSFLLSKAFIPSMIKQQWGRLVFISSVVGMRGAPGTVAYAASKSAITGMARVFCKEYARFNITSNVLCLGYFEAGLIESLSDKQKETILSQIPSRSWGKVSNITNSIRWLIDSEYVNGAVISLDGGI
jgi:NAD(P)-dependent dehydrogenase (short-subunit alcohol dehydrogenase family)